MGLGLASAAMAQETQTYTYDVHGRLTRVARAVGTTTRTTNYTLDNADGRTQRATTVTTGAGLTAQVTAPSAVADESIDDGSERPASASTAQPSSDEQAVSAPISAPTA
jgi:YD repeat-containing protein